MNKSDLIEIVADRCHISKTLAKAVTCLIFDTVLNTVMCGNKVYISGFGSFFLKERAKRVGRNISAGTKIEIGKRSTIFFKPSSSIKEKLKRSCEHGEGNPC